MFFVFFLLRQTFLSLLKIPFFFFNPEQDKWPINPTSHSKVISAEELSDAVKMGQHYEINSTINGTVLQFKEDLPTVTIPALTQTSSSNSPAFYN